MWKRACRAWANEEWAASEPTQEVPPTLIASIYGMNFDYMPELKWLLGYPFALGLMVLSAILPYLFFKRRGWL